MQCITVFTNLHFCSSHGDNNGIVLRNLFSNVCDFKTPKRSCRVNERLNRIKSLVRRVN